ncbi:hypothetical protein DTO006G1_3019 [Penicillium roqueforti]|uniref:uncharacterized protein n=1 Tax=Penicillium roqueforti TaxID=5082 RepID=UPI00190C08EB|nr:uncharacterized protein LCP9604111_2267 [Penicillium roqueforti]KAF9252271.1 hypothetical protein LCP9604111_2267 [Penicillium roqueforti]KAI1837541.1 hypothetical protein CBS147337_1824 [Penicillium roqueforti]KAI2682399.1 hypothetical protein LCP963914a_6287 [Penicillium roqueforti]KAI2690380.1 hypothetical protein CBS147355_831 [Penicillium roqueforti]KAI2702189.1 hypothetical protein CBS147372_3922 [Penicillium roqueforti]
MAKAIFTAWKTKSQLLEVRDEFYPPSAYAGPDLRSHGCAVVEAWKLRGNVPHHVEATALLTDAILHDDAQRNSIFSIRATYSAAFCRFVTGLVDTKIHGVRRTMFQRATDLGLPASFVELRHEATHREPPSLVVLRKAAQRSLEWLWDNYWAGVGDDSGAPALTHEDGASVRAVLCDALQPLSSGSVDPVSKKRKRDQAISVAMRLVSVCNVSATGVRHLPSVLLERGFLIPRGRELGDSMNDTFKEWNPVLQKVAEIHPAFLRHLTEDLVNDLAFKNTTDISEDAPSEALYLWIAHILTSPAWEFHRQSCPQSYVLRACDESPHHWTNMLGDQLRKQTGKSKSVLTARPAKNRISKPKHVRNDSQYAPSQLSDKLLEHGWGFLEKWDSRPLGVVSSN